MDERARAAAAAQAASLNNNAAASNELDFVSVIAMMDDPALRREMLFQLSEA